ncbi:hypothetical protein HDU98_011881 [Podochytrium sp. JEL0797]|nr:hypothetical protein HDU98_011881 [Podochytrium sp. JEL0797]
MLPSSGVPSTKRPLDTPPDPDPLSGPGRSKPGRKPLPETEAPASYQVARQRANQRAFRERKANELKTLQDEVHALRQQLANQEPAPSTPSSDPTLLARIAALESENQALKSFAFTFMKQVPHSLASSVPFASGPVPPVSFAPDLSLYSQLFTPFPDTFFASANPAASAPRLNSTTPSPPRYSSASDSSPPPSIESDPFTALLLPSSADAVPAEKGVTSQQHPLLNPVDPKHPPKPEPHQPDDFSAFLDFTTYRDDPNTINDVDPFDFLHPTTTTITTDLNLDFLLAQPTTTTTPQRFPLALHLPIPESARTRICATHTLLKSIPSLYTSQTVDELCDAFATCSMLGIVPGSEGVSEGEKEHVLKMEELKGKVVLECIGSKEDGEAVGRVLGGCQSEGHCD